LHCLSIQLHQCISAIVMAYPTVQQQQQGQKPPPSLTSRYLKRLGIDNGESNADDLSAPTIETLRFLQERHLATVPFENSAQHGAYKHGPQVLDAEATARKILDSKRGGFCFELNALFGVWLEELGYRVTWVPSVVYKPDGGVGFNRPATHVLLIVTVGCGEGAERYYAGVGFAEPPLHPLSYDVSGKEQVTPEGMRSKLVRECTDDSGDDDYVVMYWFRDGEWAPRLRWSYQAAEQPPNDDNRYSSEVFRKGLEEVQQPCSTFSQKLIACLLTDEYKITVAGNKLKITGPGRFPSSLPLESSSALSATSSFEQSTDTSDDNATTATIKIERTILESVDEVREVLRDRMGIPMSETVGLDLSKSLDADPSLWSHQ